MNESDSCVLRGAADDAPDAYAVHVMSRKVRPLSLTSSLKGVQESIAIESTPGVKFKLQVNLYKSFPTMPYDQADDDIDPSATPCTPFKSSRFEANIMRPYGISCKANPKPGYHVVATLMSGGNSLILPTTDYQKFFEDMALAIRKKGFMISAYSQQMPSWPEQKDDESRVYTYNQQGEVDSSDDEDNGHNKAELPNHYGRKLAFDIDCPVRLTQGDPELDGNHVLSERARQLGAYITAIVFRVVADSDRFRCLVEDHNGLKTLTKVCPKTLCTSIICQRQVDPMHGPTGDSRMKFCLHIYFPYLIVSPTQQTLFYSIVGSYLSFSGKDSIGGLHGLGGKTSVDKIMQLRNFGCVKKGTKCISDTSSEDLRVKQTCQSCRSSGIPFARSKNGKRFHFHGHGGNYRFVASFKPQGPGKDGDVSAVILKSSSMSLRFQRVQEILDRQFECTLSAAKAAQDERLAQPIDENVVPTADELNAEPAELDLDALMSTKESQKAMADIVYETYNCTTKDMRKLIPDDDYDLQQTAFQAIRAKANATHMADLAALLEATAVFTRNAKESLFKLKEPDFQMVVDSFGVKASDYQTVDGAGDLTNCTSFTEVYNKLSNGGGAGGGGGAGDPGVNASEFEYTVIKCLIRESRAWNMVNTNEMTIKKKQGKKPGKAMFMVSMRGICLLRQGEHTSNRIWIMVRHSLFSLFYVFFVGLRLGLAVGFVVARRTGFARGFVVARHTGFARGFVVARGLGRAVFLVLGFAAGFVFVLEGRALVARAPADWSLLRATAETRILGRASLPLCFLAKACSRPVLVTAAR